MKRKELSSKKIVVIPTARRSGTDAKLVQRPQNVKKILGQLRENEEMEKISKRLAAYAASTRKELVKLKQAAETHELDMVQRIAETLASLSAEAGVNEMLRICYQMVIAVRQGQVELIHTLQNALNEEFRRFKATLQVAT